MPLRFIEVPNPEVPAWGELELDVYLLSEWDKPHPDPLVSNESPADRKPPASPTQAQIDDILRPARPEALRVYGHNTGADAGCWIRLCYTNEEGHNALWSANESAQWVTYGGVVLDDESIFGGLDLAAALEIFPERVTNEAVNIELREESLKDAKWSAEEGDWAENPLGPYALYQADCVVTHMYVEDDVAVNGGGVLHVFLDDRGNVVRQWRVQDDGSESNYDGTSFAGVWKVAFEGEKGEVGPAYREGERTAAPHTHLENLRL
ncbi:hypothetical protein N7468_006162 [Penicillium chermesinum]|uniref:Uncharacterized protein n=1 Tax=Penicillium chermesinum TaxID=63820 RepID=A0A9W9NRP9_9EURO|nr:uncharacterized protein N7468_006162 [Penicillium chermesinum]KAJ5224937.1 hypothetical protein N7468_006162 [Penicillium chermesinum]